MCGDVALVFEAREGEWGCGAHIKIRPQTNKKVNIEFVMYWETYLGWSKHPPFVPLHLAIELRGRRE
jgi:hypothetical protein